MKYFLIFVLIMFAGSVYGQSERKVDSKVSAATIFKNRALVTREAELSFESGKHKVILSNLPNDLQDESVRISSDGENIKILDVEVESKFTTETQQDKIKKLENQIDSLKQLVQVASDKILVYNSEKEFIESLKAQSSKNFSEKLLKVNSTAEWNEMLKYIENNLSEIYKGLREQNRKKFLYEQQINVINAEVNNSRGTKSKNYKEITINLESKSNKKIKLFASYLVQNASWYPLYDVRVSIADKNTELNYFGMVHQSTGEDWNNISLTLSTAEPMSIKSLPELSRWFLDVNRGIYLRGGSQNESAFYISTETAPLSNTNVTYKLNSGLPAGTGVISGYIIDSNTGEPLAGANAMIEGTSFGAASDVNGKFYISNVPAGGYQLRISFIGYQPMKIALRVIEKNIAELTAALPASAIESNDIVVTAERPVVMKDMATSRVLREDEQYTNISHKELSTTFEVPSKSTIPSDNSAHKVTVAINNLPVEFSYTSIPKITPAVYLKGKIVNNKDYPFLEGDMNIFVDNDFINKTSSRMIVPTDTLELALGIDDKIQIKKVLINKFQETKGLLGGSRQISYDYEIQLTNNRKSEENIMVYDQVPITMNEDIAVKLIEPEKDIKELGNENKLEWKVNLKPGEKKTIPLKYQVVFLNKLSVSGLE